MTTNPSALRDSVKKFCTDIGADPLLVQGAGGNVSWKDEDVLWIKASGTWLAEAQEKDIFVPVALSKLRSSITSGDFSAKPELLIETSLKPSIETILHALMPHRVVAHLHAIEILFHLVKNNFVDLFETHIPKSVQWVYAEYKKPGEELARVVNNALSLKNANVVFLQNHGVVIGGDSTDEIFSTLNILIDGLKATLPRQINKQIDFDSITTGPEATYILFPDNEIHELVHHPEYFYSLKKQWALYPDHVVFLGARPFTYTSKDQFLSSILNNKETPDLVFIKNTGVYIKENFSIAKRVQLRCYYDVLIRLQGNESLHSLTPKQIAELLNWDAEQYRMSIAR
ncbi:class II aldolase [Pseudomonas sp. MIL9]|uniref:class II aldolase/adducin family protein n=1 Tax=Pseudomonas sp. MIL9 TaxID=2807620 RepID=UPI00194E8A81|nr:class II aldolase/adducin family protein [Pseudomonas sp. MIL9]MBM6446952.1 class II aldolase [Pseudomonas sp. MIL9]